MGAVVHPLIWRDLEATVDQMERPKKKMKLSIPLFLLATSIIASQSRAQTNRPVPREMVIIAGGKLPPSSQRSGEALFLYTSECDSSYLYIEQDQGKTLTVLDVGDPRKIKLKGEVHLDSVPFEFLRRMNDEVVLIQYRDGSGFGFLNLHHPKRPVVKRTNSSFSDTYIEPVVSRDVAHRPLRESMDIQDYKVINGKDGTVLATVKQVRQILADHLSGATYLLGEDGLTVVRNPRIESRADFPCVIDDLD